MIIKPLFITFFTHSKIPLWFQERYMNYNHFNPLTPMSDQDRISPYNIDTISSRQGMRVKKNINLGIISWSNYQLSELTL